MRDQKLSLNRSSLKARQDYLLEAEEGTLNLPSEFTQIGGRFGTGEPYNPHKHLHVVVRDGVRDGVPYGVPYLVASSNVFGSLTHHVMKIDPKTATELMGGSNMSEERLQQLHSHVVRQAQEPYLYMHGGKINDASMSTQQLLALFEHDQKYESTRTPRFSKLINEIANHITEEQDKRARLLGETAGMNMGGPPSSLGNPAEYRADAEQAAKDSRKAAVARGDIGSADVDASDKGRQAVYRILAAAQQLGPEAIEHGGTAPFLGAGADLEILKNHGHKVAPEDLERVKALIEHLQRTVDKGMGRDTAEQRRRALQGGNPLGRIFGEK
jgi:hypothetical protein